MAGVINILTKDSSTKTLHQVSIQAGSKDYYRASQHSSLGPLTLSTSVQRDEGLAYRGSRDESGQAIDLNYKNNYENYHLRYQHNTVTVDSAGFHQRKAKLGLLPNQAYHGQSEFSGFYINFTLEHTLNDSTEIHSRFSYDRLDRDMDVGQFPAPGYDGRADNRSELQVDSELKAIELQTRHQLSTDQNLIAGYHLESQYSSPYYFRYTADGSISPFSSYTSAKEQTNHALFAQFNWSINNLNSVIVGGRIHFDTKTEDTTFVPRIGWVHQISDHNFLKLLYGEAFRSPNIFERQVNVDGVLYGDPNLSSEKITSLDLALDSRLGTQATLRLNAFYLELNELISRVISNEQTGQAQYINSENQHIYGLEAEYRWLSASRHSAIVTANVQQENDGQSGVGGNQLWQYSSNTARQYRIDNHWSWNTSLQFRGPQKFTTSDNQSAINAKSFWLANSNIQYQQEDWKLIFKIQNLLNQNYQQAEYVRRNIDTIPAANERRLYLGLSYQW